MQVYHPTPPYSPVSTSPIPQPYLRSPRTALIHTLDDDSLLNIFHLYRPFSLGEDEDDEAHLSGGNSTWNLERWWYKLVHVCRRWRYLILASPSHLSLCLVCTHGTPVVDMLAHSPLFPLIIDYLGDITAEDEAGVLFALEQHDRVRRVRFQLPVPKLQKLITAINEEYPVLEHLIMGPLIEDNNPILILPERLQAVHLHHLRLTSFALPIRSRLLTTAAGLVTLNLIIHHPSAYFPPSTLIQWLSFMPQLETLVILIFPVRNLDVERQLTRTPVVTRLTLPNLRWFGFQGISAYLEAVVHRVTTPRLEKLQILFFNQLTFSVPHLKQFMSRTESLRLASATSKFSSKEVYMEVYPRTRKETEIYTLRICVLCCHLDWQVSSVAQIFNSLSQMFSSVERLTLEFDEHSRSSEEQSEVDRAEWREFFGSFSNMTTLLVDDELIEKFSHCLRLDSGELPLKPVLLPINPQTPGVYIHPALAAPSLLYDIRSHPSGSNPRLSPAVLTTPASSPPLPSLALRVGDLPWLFTVWPDAGHSPENAVVTVQDVLLAIYFHLRTAVKGDEYEAMSRSRKVEIFRAFDSRVRTDQIQRGKGLRRVDLLRGRFHAQGLVRAQSKDSVWDVVIQ